jgi:hypothetical protein
VRISGPPTDVNTVGYRDPRVVDGCNWNDLRKEKTTLEKRVILMPVSRQLRYFSEICNTLFAIRYSLFATSFEQCNRFIRELFKFDAGLWIRIDFNLDPVPALDFWGF